MSAALMAGENRAGETDRCRVAPGERQRGTAVPARHASPAVSAAAVPSREEEKT